MCDPVTLGIAAVATTAIGAGTQMIAGNNAASAARSAQAEAQTAQNEAFNQRLTAQRQDLAQQTAINTDAASRFNEDQAAQQQAQMSALQQRGQTVQQMNQQQQATTQQADNTVKQGLASTDAQHLQDAQVQQQQQQQALNAPVVQQTAVSNPLGKLNGSSAVTKQAMDTADAGAASYVKNYGDTQARLSSYAAPIATARSAAANIGTNLMPASVMDQLVRTGAPAILAPSTLAYQQAGNYGRVLAEAEARRAAGLTSIANTGSQDAIDIANLGQTDRNTVAQNNLTLAQTRAAQLAGLGQGLMAFGNLGTGLAGARGAFSKVLGTPGVKVA